MDTFKKIQEMIAEQLGIDKERITANSELVADLKADSLDVMELVMDIEEEFKVEIPDDILPTIKTVNDIVEQLEKR